MTKRGKKSHTTIAGHTLTWAELTVLHQLQDFMSRAGGDPVVPLSKMFPASDSRSNAKRYCARHLAELGVLTASGVALVDDFVKRKTT